MFGTTPTTNTTFDNLIFTQTKFEPTLLIKIEQHQKTIQQSFAHILSTTKSKYPQGSLDDTFLLLRLTLSDYFLLKHHCLYPYILRSYSSNFSIKEKLLEQKRDMYNTYQQILCVMKTSEPVDFSDHIERRKFKSLVFKILINQHFEKTEIFPLYKQNPA